MADDRETREGQDQEFKITVRDRRRVTSEGDIREVEDTEATTSATTGATTPSADEVAEQLEALDGGDSAAAEPGRPETTTDSGDMRTPTAAERRAERRRRRAEQAGQRSGAGNAAHLQDVDQGAADDAEDSPPNAEGEPPPVRDVYEYLLAVSSEMMIWALAGLGLVQNPYTRLVSTDMQQARFAIDTAERLLDSLDEADKLEEETAIAVTQSYIMQFASVAAQLLSQPPATQLAEISKIRFCIDVAQDFLERLQEHADSLDATQLVELRRALQELQLRFVQASGGGGLVG